MFRIIYQKFNHLFNGSHSTQFLNFTNIYIDNFFVAELIFT